MAGLRPVPSGIGDAPVAWTAADISGIRPDGSPVRVDIGAAQRPVLLVFLSTHCDGCDLFWSGVRDRPPAGVATVVITKGSGRVPRVEVAELATGIEAPVVLSDRAWVDYRVTGYPFLVLVEVATRRILAESVGFGWADVAALIEGAVDG